MRAVILAAGRGSRLGKRSRHIPKCLLQLGDRTLIEHQLEALSEAGVAPVCVVVGFCADEVREVVGIRAEFIENPRWSTTNSIYSFALAHDWATGPLLVLNSDTIVHPEILDRLLDHPGDAIAYDSSSGDGREHMKVKVERGLLVDMSKRLASEDVSGENVGVLKFTEAGARELFEIAGKLVDQGRERAWLGSAVRELVKTREVHAIDVAGIPWGEIDSCYDLDQVRRHVLPHLEPRARRRRRAARLTGRLSGAALLLVLCGLAFLNWWTRPSTPWESIAISGQVAHVNIASEARLQDWWLLEQTARAGGLIRGPDTVRIDTRLVLPDGVDGSEEEIPYVIEVDIDGERVGWFDETTTASRSWALEGHPIGRRQGTRVEVPPGDHEVGVRLIAADSGRLLVRMRQVAVELEE